MRERTIGVSASDMAETVSNHGSTGHSPGHSMTERGREIVREYVNGLDAPAREYASAKRVLAEVGHYHPQENETPDRGATRDVGVVLAAIRDGETAGTYLPHVSVERWSDSKPATWIIEVEA